MIWSVVVFVLQPWFSLCLDVKNWNAVFGGFSFDGYVVPFYNSLINLGLKSIFLDFKMATTPCFLWPFAWNIIFFIFLINHNCFLLALLQDLILTLILQYKTFQLLKVPQSSQNQILKKNQCLKKNPKSLSSSSLSKISNVLKYPESF